MKLVPVVEEDLQLYLDMFCNPEYMKFLGGPQTHEQVKETKNIYLFKYLFNG